MEEIKKNDVDNIKTLQNRIINILSKSSQEKFTNTFDTKIYAYDPDSSPKAWEFYLKYYNKLFEEQNELDTYNTPLFEDDEETIAFWIQNIQDPYKRICGTFSYENLNEKKKITLSDSKVKENSIGFAGDCCFNFNEKKILSLCDIIDSNKIGSDKIDSNKEAKKLLYLCYFIHYSPYNFALMPTNGGMNKKKGGGKNDLDRFDKFIFNLSTYFSDKSDENFKKISYKQEGSEILEKFLKSIESFDQYCDFFYPELLEDKKLSEDEKLSEDKELCNRLIKSGKQPIKQFDENGKLDVKKTTNRLLEYIELAIDFWEAKAKYFEKVTKQQNQANNSTTE